MRIARSILLAAWLTAGPAWAGLSPAEAARQWQEAQGFTDLPALEEDASPLTFQYALIERLTAHLGRPVGYKAALTNPQAQQMFGVTGPVLGILLEKMLLPDNTELPLSYAARPAIEADLLVRVSDPNINEARTDLDLLAGLDAIIPFLELPDLALPPGAAGQADILTALNTGARAGIQGRILPVRADAETLDRLGRFTVRLVDGAGNLLGQGRGADLMGHPIQVVRWIRDTLAARGERLRAGDLLSLGTLTPIVPLRNGGHITAHYEGLSPDDGVSVSCILHEAATTK